MSQQFTIAATIISVTSALHAAGVNNAGANNADATDADVGRWRC